MRYVFGVKVLAWWRCSTRRNKSNRPPKGGERSYYIDLGSTLLFVNWKKHRGYRVCSEISDDAPEHPTVNHWAFPSEPMALRKKNPDATILTIPALTVADKWLKEHPLLAEFITATAFEDGSPRTPGYYWYKNCLIEHEITLFDPSNGLRLRVRSRDWNALWRGVEAMLGAEDAPWEVDNYLFGKLPKKKKK